MATCIARPFNSHKSASCLKILTELNNYQLTNYRTKRRVKNRLSAIKHRLFGVNEQRLPLSVHWLSSEALGVVSGRYSTADCGVFMGTVFTDVKGQLRPRRDLLLGVGKCETFEH